MRRNQILLQVAAILLPVLRRLLSRNLSCNFVATQVAREIARCIMPRNQHASLAIFLLQQPLHEVESGSIFRNDRGNVATHF
jgi:hypothetical protein